jgi:hypothetical protein
MYNTSAYDSGEKSLARVMVKKIGRYLCRSPARLPFTWKFLVKGFDKQDQGPCLNERLKSNI